MPIEKTFRLLYLYCLIVVISNFKLQYSCVVNNCRCGCPAIIVFTSTWLNPSADKIHAALFLSTIFHYLLLFVEIGNFHILGPLSYFFFFFFEMATINTTINTMITTIQIIYCNQDVGSFSCG